MTKESGTWLRRFHPGPAGGTRLICFPHAGGSASYFHPVSRELSPVLDVQAVQYPGRQERRHEPQITDIAGLADGVMAEILPLADRPLAFFGHSMGSVVAFEVALRLREQGVTPLALFASGRRAPSCVREESLHKESDQALVAEVKSLGGTDPRMLDDPELLAMVLPAMRADYTAVMTYRCQPDAVVNSPVHVLVGDDDPHVSQDEALRWKEHTSGAFEMKVFGGGHFYLNDHAPAVLRYITETLTVR